MDFNAPFAVDPHLTLASRVLLSPMAGVMGPVFCRAASKLDFVRNWLTPFLSVGAGSVSARGPLRKKLEPFRNGYALIVQELGHDPASMAETAERLAELGAAGINLNFACPSPLVLKNRNGGAVLEDPDLLFAIADAAVKRAGGRANISVKIRTGVRSPDELPRLAEAVAAAKIRLVVCHFRTVEEIYRPVPFEVGLARLRRLRELLPPEIAIFGNGDIHSFADAEKMCAETSCAGVAVGRGAFADPFLLKKIRAGTDEPADDAEKLAFLHALEEAADELGADTRRWRRNAFLEFAKLVLGAESEHFRELVRNHGFFPSVLTEKP